MASTIRATPSTLLLKMNTLAVSTPCPPARLSPQSEGNSAIADDDDENSDATPTSSIPPLDLGSPTMNLNTSSFSDLLHDHISTFYHQPSQTPSSSSSSDDDSMFHFNPSNPPSLSRLATWLGLDNTETGMGMGMGSVSAALLFQEQAVQTAFATATATATGKGKGKGVKHTASSPVALKLCLPFFACPEKEMLTTWRRKLARGKGKGKSKGKGRGMNNDNNEGGDEWDEWEVNSGVDGVDISAVLFAARFVRFVENSCEYVSWRPLGASSRLFDGEYNTEVSGSGKEYARGGGGGSTSLEDFETARRRWAVALQVFWFLARAFEGVRIGA